DTGVVVLVFVLPAEVVEAAGPVVVVVGHVVVLVPVHDGSVRVLLPRALVLERHARGLPGAAFGEPLEAGETAGVGLGRGGVVAPQDLELLRFDRAFGVHGQHRVVAGEVRRHQVGEQVYQLHAALGLRG